MGMGMPEPAVVMPDTYGLPVYKINKIIKQRVGDEMHFLCGEVVFGQTIWHYIATMKVNDVIEEAQECVAIACGANPSIINARHAS